MDFVLKFPKVVILAVCLFAGFLGSALPLIEIDASPWLFDALHPSRQAQLELQATFTHSGPTVIIAIAPEGGLVFTSRTLSVIEALTESLEAMHLLEDGDNGQLKINSGSHAMDNPGDRESLRLPATADDIAAVREILGFINEGDGASIFVEEEIALRINPVVSVKSLSNVEDFIDHNDTLRIAPLIDQLRAGFDPRLLEHVLNNPLITELLLSIDGRTALIHVELAIPTDQSRLLRLFDNKLSEIISGLPEDHSYHVAGEPVIVTTLDKTMERDNAYFFPIVILIVALVIMLAFRNIAAVILVSIVCILTLVSTLGLMAHLNVDVNILTSGLPVFLVSIAVADGIHFLSKYSQLTIGRATRADVTCATAMRGLWRPMGLTTITSAIAFLSLSLTDLSFIKEFAYFIAFGAVIALVYTITVIPALLIVCSERMPGFTFAVGKGDRVTDVFMQLSSRLVRNPAVSLVLLVVMLAGLIYLASGVRVDNENIRAFDRDSKLVKDHEFILSRVGGYIPLNIWFKAEGEENLLSGDTMQAIEDIDRFVNRYEHVSKTLSYLDYIDHADRTLRTDQSAESSSNASLKANQLLFLYENSSDKDIRSVIDESYYEARLIVLGDTDKASLWRALIQDLDAYAKSVLPTNVSMRVTGYGELMVSNILSVVDSQILSFSVALLVIGALMLTIFRSMVLTLIAMVPIIIAITINLAVMAFFDVPLDIATTLVMCIAYGIGIDYAIHMLTHIQSAIKRERLTGLQASRSAVKQLAMPIVVNSLAIAMGFLVLTLSDYAGLSSLGYLISLSMVSSALLSLLIVPLLVGLLGPGGR